jgi:mRNA interferase RelE/StbE
VNVVFTDSFRKDLKRISDALTRQTVREAIVQLEQARSLRDITALKKLRASGSYFRLRIGDYRLGIALEGDTVKLVRFLHRSEIYRYFP